MKSVRVLVFSVAGLLGLLTWDCGVVYAGHLSCPAEHRTRAEGVDWCADPTHFLNGLCIAEPAGKNQALQADPSEVVDMQEVGGDVLCLLGKMDTVGMENLVDFTASVTFQPSNQFEALLEIDPGFFAPEIESLIPAAVPDSPDSPDSNGEFQALLVLPRQGQYNLKIQTRSVRDGLLSDSVAIKRIVRLSTPHLTVEDARGKKGRDESIGGFSLMEQHVDEAGMGEVGPAHSVTVTPPPGGNAMDAIEFCLKTDDPPVEHPGHEGSVLEFSAVNRITDVSGSDRRGVTITCTPTNRICSASAGTADFCDGGHILKIPMGNGTNEIEINANSRVGDERIVVTPIQNDLKGPKLCIAYLNQRGDPIPADSDGKVLVVLPSPSEAEAGEVMVDVTLGDCGGDAEEVALPSPPPAPPGVSEAPPPAAEPPRRQFHSGGGSPTGLAPNTGDYSPSFLWGIRNVGQSFSGRGLPTNRTVSQGRDVIADLGRCHPENPQPDPEGTWPVLIKRQNEPEFLKMCAVERDGRTHFQAKFRHLKFPINTMTIKAKDLAGNETLESHSFLFGNVRPLFGMDGHLNLEKALVPKGVGGFLTQDYLTGELKQILLKVLNSDKFKNETFPKLLDPRKPGLEEQECLQEIQEETGCGFDHLGDFEHMGDAQRVVAIKLFCDEGECGGIGDFEIPYFHFLNDNRIQIQLKLKGLKGRAEMYTMQFTDSDNPPDGIVDTEDDDDDNDGLLDKDDTDDDNDGVPDERDLPGRIIEDPDYGTLVLPIRFTVKELILNLQIQLEKDDEGRIKVRISQIPGRSLIQSIPDGRYRIEFDCDKIQSEIRQGGRAEDEGNGQLFNLVRDGDQENCRALERANSALSGHEGPLIDFFIDQGKKKEIGLGRYGKFPIPGGALVDPAKRQTQSTDQQFRCTMEAVARCSTPKRLEASLAKFETEKVTAISQELMKKKFNFDFFSPLGKSDITADPVGVGFSGGGVLLPAGVTSPDDETKRDASVFLENLPLDLRKPKFGPVFEKEVPEGEQVDPIEAAYGMGSEIGLALKEETINSLLHGVNIQLFDLNRQEDHALARGEITGKTLDTFAKKFREENGLGMLDVGGTVCRDKNNQKLDPSQTNGGLDTKWECFPFPLSLSVLLGDDTLNYADLDGDGVFNQSLDPQIPVLIRTTLNRFAAPTVKVVNVSAPSDTIFAEMEVGLPPLRMALFEEQFETVNFIAPETGLPEGARRGTGRVKSWCDRDRFPGMDPARCNGGVLQDSPIVVFEATGKVSLTLMIDRGDNGILRISAGITSKDSPTGPVVDTDKSFLRVSTIENNTLAPDQKLAKTFEGNMNTILGDFRFGTPRTINLKVPAMVPLLPDSAHPHVQAFCQKFRGEIPEICDCEANPEGPDCDKVGLIQQTWDKLDLDEDFGIAGFELQDPLIGLAGPGDGSPRYLTVGIGTCVKDEEGRCIGE